MKFATQLVLGALLGIVIAGGFIYAVITITDYAFKVLQ